jgi:hypothetical protein
MTSPQDRITDAVRRGQETVNSTVRTWTDGMQKIVTNLDVRNTVPTLEELVDNSYAFAVQVLAMQRDFTKSLIAHAQPWTENLSNAPKRAERFILRTERTAAKKAEEVAAKTETVAADAEKTASKAQHSAASRSRATKN